MFDSEFYALYQRFADYTLVFKGFSDHTLRGYKGYVRRMVKLTGIQEVKEFDREFMEKYIFHGKTELKWSAKTIKNTLQFFCTFCDWLVEREYVKENFVRKIPKPRLPKLLPRSLSHDEALELLDWSIHFPYAYKFERTRGAAMMALFIFSGIRRSELRNLKMEDVDLETYTLFVSRGKGDKDRVIPLNIRAVRILETYVKDRKRLNRTCPYFFCSLRHNTPMEDEVIKRFIVKLRTQSNIHFTPHMLRHTFATLMIEGGCDIYSLSKMMGHTDIKTTTIYLSASTKLLREEINKHPLSFIGGKKPY